jgi:hypothetical protein
MSDTVTIRVGDRTISGLTFAEYDVDGDPADQLRRYAQITGNREAIVSTWETCTVEVEGDDELSDELSAWIHCSWGLEKEA